MTTTKHEKADAGPKIGTLDVDGKPIRVWLRVHHDGIEYIGRLWFGDDPGATRGVMDHGVIPGNTRENVRASACRLTSDELRQRYERAMRERRKYDPLRRLTQDMLAKVRRLNQVAIALQAGLIEPADGADQLAETESQLHELVARLRDVAGVQDEPAE